METNNIIRNSAHSEFEIRSLPFRNRLHRTALILTGSPRLAKGLVHETFVQARHGYRRFDSSEDLGRWMYRILFGAFWANRHRVDRQERELFNRN